LKKTIAMAGLALAATAFTATPAKAGADAYIGEVFTFAGTFCPRNTMEAKGQTLLISEHQALFALLGTTYGGDGRTTFNLPRLFFVPSSTMAKMKHCIVVQGIFPSRS